MSASTLMSPASAGPRGPVVWLAFALTALLALGGCAVNWIAGYDAQSTERITALSKSTLGLYQELLAVPAGKRSAAASGALKPKYGDVETQLRVHLVTEQARAKNSHSIKVAGEMLSSWVAIGKQHTTAPADALSDRALEIERDILERQLRSAFQAEEAKKLGGGSIS